MDKAVNEGKGKGLRVAFASSGACRKNASASEANPRRRSNSRAALRSVFTRSLVETSPLVRSTSFNNSLSRERLLVVRVAIAIRIPNIKAIVAYLGHRIGYRMCKHVVVEVAR